MKLWTIQKPVAYADLIKNGFYRTDSSYISSDKLTAYDWQAEQLSQRVSSPPEGVSHPVWAWYKLYNEQKKPDFRNAGYAPTGTELVCMELEVPDSLVLLSDYDDWTFVLQGLYVHDTGKDELFDYETSMLEAMSEEQRTRAVRNSWNKIFDIRSVFTSKGCRGINVQGAMWEIRKEYIRKTWTFKAK